MTDLMRIGELARRTGCPTETIRYYEAAGLLPAPLRSLANYRLYGAAHAERLAFIRHCRALDMALDEVRALLALRDGPDQDCSAVNDLLDAHIAHVERKVTELQALQAELLRLRARCAQTQPARACGILQGLAEGTDNPMPPRLHGCQ